MSIVKDFFIKQGRRRALKIIEQEIERYREKVAKTDSDMFLNVFNSGLYVNVKKAGDMILNLTQKILEKERKKRS